MDFIETIKNNAKMKSKKIVLPEGIDLRTLKAASILTKEDIAKIILVGPVKEIRDLANKNAIDLTETELIDPAISPKLAEYSNKLFEIRKHKGLTREQAQELVKDPLYFGTMMVKLGDADGMVAGAMNTTGDVLRPALQIIKTQKGISSVSGIYIMILPDKDFGANGIMMFADCAVNPNPTAEQLAETAYLTDLTSKCLIGMENKIALLSFSTKGSAKHELADKVILATKIAREKYPQLCIDGELQVDTALIPKVGQLKAPNSTVAGQANILIFPDLQSGNIGYKLVERLAKAKVIGPILQGMDKPINDLSRGSSVEDIINTAAVTALQCDDHLLC